MILFHIFGTVFTSEFYPFQILMPVSFLLQYYLQFNKKQIQILMKKITKVLQVIIVASMNVFKERSNH